MTPLNMSQSWDKENIKSYSVLKQNESGFGLRKFFAYDIDIFHV